jgi:ribosomal protein RSM22 (predicted rRNA methylase)
MDIFLLHCLLSKAQHTAAAQTCKAKSFFRTEKFFHSAEKKLLRKAQDDIQYCLGIYHLKRELPFQKLLQRTQNNVGKLVLS